jgi:hypothetical protein
MFDSISYRPDSGSHVIMIMRPCLEQSAAPLGGWLGSRTDEERGKLR